MGRVALVIIIVLGIFGPLAGCQRMRAWLVGFVEFEGDVDAKTPDDIALVADSNTPKMQLKKVTASVRMPTDIIALPGSKHEVVVLQKDGEAVILDTDSGKHRPFFSVEVVTTSEQGLLGLAFSPDYAATKRFYVHYNPKAGESRTKIAEWVGDKKPREKRTLLEVKQPYPNHNGGQIRFGPDGFLYIGLGDGGWADDPHDNGQNPKAFLGSMLRMDVSAVKPSAKVYAYGLRNPWKFDFDSQGRIVAGDVGQNKFEEVTFVFADGNHGWNVFEGFDCFEGSKKCKDRDAFVAPLWQYGRSLGGSITGGVVSRDPRFSAIQNWFVFGDYVSGRIWALPLPKKNERIDDARVKELGDTQLNISTFGVDGRGHIYLGDFGGGAIYKLMPAAPEKAP